jgi:hypothetical protein
MAPMNLPADPASLRRSVYVLLIVVAVAGLSGRIIGVGRVYEPWLSRDPNRPEDTRGNWPATRPQPQPTHGDNDRSRWATVRALVEKHTYAIGHRDFDPAAGTYADSGIVFEDGWKSID